MSQVVIGEAVILDLQPARLPSRALAFALDALIVVVLLVVLLVIINALGAQFDDALTAAVSIALIVGVVGGYPILWETLTRGRSPGKYALGLRVVRDDGGPIRFRHALTRSLTGLLLDFGVFSGGSGFVAVAVSLSSSRGKRVGDLLAGTVVLRERVPRSARGELPGVHPGLAGWAGNLELSRVSDDLALTGRQFLVRAPQLDPAVRSSMAERIAGDVAARVAPPPPPGVPAEVYLTTVLAERRRRETERLRGARANGSPAPGPISSPTPGPTPSPMPSPMSAPANGPWSPAPAPVTGSWSGGPGSPPSSPPGWSAPRPPQPPSPPAPGGPSPAGPANPAGPGFAPPG